MTISCDKCFKDFSLNKDPQECLAAHKRRNPDCFKIKPTYICPLCLKDFSETNNPKQDLGKHLKRLKPCVPKCWDDMKPPVDIPMPSVNMKTNAVGAFICWITPEAGIYSRVNNKAYKVRFKDGFKTIYKNDFLCMWVDLFQTYFPLNYNIEKWNGEGKTWMNEFDNWVGNNNYEILITNMKYPPKYSFDYESLYKLPATGKPTNSLWASLEYAFFDPDSKGTNLAVVNEIYT